jgi:hypothetical protein
MSRSLGFLIADSNKTIDLYLNKTLQMKKFLLFACVALLVSCGSDDNAPENNDDNTAGVAYIRGKRDNTTFDYTFYNTVDDAFLYSGGTGFSGEGFDRWYYYSGGVMAFNPPNFAPEFYIAWNHAYFGANGDEAGESAAFYDTVGDLPTNFLTDAQNQAHVAGLEIVYKSADGTIYASTGGSQSGSSLSVNGSTPGGSAADGTQNVTILGTFSCKLYNTDDATDVINVTDGTFKIILQEYQ